MATRVVALVEHPALEDTAARVEVETRRRMNAADRRGRGRGRTPADQLALIDAEPDGEAAADAD
jgi:hypothetical protein